MMMATPEVESVFSVIGFSFSGSAPNQGLIFTLLKPFDEREEAEQRIQAAAAPAARAAVRHPGRAGHSRSRRPRSTASATFGGFTFEVLDQAAAATSTSSAAARWR